MSWLTVEKKRLFDCSAAIARSFSLRILIRKWFMTRKTTTTASSRSTIRKKRKGCFRIYSPGVSSASNRSSHLPARSSIVPSARIVSRVSLTFPKSSGSSDETPKLIWPLAISIRPRNFFPSLPNVWRLTSPMVWWAMKQSHFPSRTACTQSVTVSYSVQFGQSW